MTARQFDLDMFIAQFPVFARAPGGIANLRGLILQLAVQGKLVDQIPSEVVSVDFLKDKCFLFGRGKELPKVQPKEKEFDIPNNWVWMRLGQVGYNHGQKKPENNFTYVDVSSINNQYGVIKNPEILKPEFAPSRARKIVTKDTLIYSTVRPYLLNIAIIDQDFSPEPIASTAFAILHACDGVDIRFIYFYLRSPIFIKYVEKVQQGVAYPAINDEKFFMGVCPVPPFEEQKRIVAKVDELMALCDHLETQQDAQARNLLEANTSSTQALVLAGDDFDRHWQRIAANFNTLYGCNFPLPIAMNRGKLKGRTVALENISKLRLAIMGLGVAGRLSGQKLISDGELEKIIQQCQEEALSEAEGSEYRKLSKQFSAEASTDSFTLSIPNHWVAVALGKVAKGFNYGTSSKSKPQGEVPVLRMGNIQGGSLDWDRLVFSDNVEDNEKYFLEKGDVLFNRTNSPELVGKTAVFDGAKKAIYAGYIIKVSCIKSLLSPDFLNLCLNSSYGKEWCLSVKSDGVSQSNINAQKLTGFIIPLPPLAEQQVIMKKVAQLLKYCDHLETLLNKQRQTTAEFSQSAAQAIT